MSKVFKTDALISLYTQTISYTKHRDLKVDKSQTSEKRRRRKEVRIF